MFDENKDVKTLFNERGGKINDTLEAFFSNKNNSQDALPHRKPLRRPKLIYENTYRLESSKPFCSSMVKTCIERTLEEMLDKAKYNTETAIVTCGAVAEKIRARVLAFEFHR